MRQQIPEMNQGISVPIYNLWTVFLLLFVKFSVGDKHIIWSWGPIIEPLWTLKFKQLI